MNFLQALLLGIIQGITEFLPVSSSGHLILLPKFFYWPLQSLMFDVALHLATALAVMVYFRKDLWKMGRGLWRWKDATLAADRGYAIAILWGIIPVGLAGLFLHDKIENMFRSPAVVIINLIFWAFFLMLADASVRPGKEAPAPLPSPTWRQSITIGLMQIFSLIPGTSRSGVTIGTGLMVGLDKKRASRFSFLMSVPLIISATLLEGRKLMTAPQTDVPWLAVAVGFISALLCGWLAIKFLLAIIESWGLKPFAYYRLVLATIILLL